MNKYTTGEASKLLGVSFITIKRWIYSGRIKAEKHSGRWLIPENEIHRLKREIEQPKQITERILDLLSSKGVAYLRELQLCLEEEFMHEETSAALNRLVPSELDSKFEWGNRWYFPKGRNWLDLRDIAEQKNALMKIYVNHPRRFDRASVSYLDYSEYLVETALCRASYVVVAKDTYYFNGVAYRPSNSAGRPTDLDFIAQIPEKNLYIGIQVKNKMQHPTLADVNVLLDICKTLHLRPILLARIIHPFTYDLLKSNNGRAIPFKRYLLQPPFPREAFQQIVAMGIPLGVYKWPPDFLIKLMMSLKQYL